MPVLERGGTREWRRRTTAEQRLRFLGALGLTAALVAAGAAISAQTTWVFVLDAGFQLRDLGTRMFPPDGSYAVSIVRPLLDTLHIATLGTALGVVIAMPLAFAAAGPTTPSRVYVRPVAILLLVTSRSVNSIIWALMLVVLLGPGVLTGVLAIALRSVGFVGNEASGNVTEAATQLNAAGVPTAR
ncbi:MAG: hypothetical protein IH804_02830 [Planctomycetes bacterium]|nr:hypothetical protein [Planctomycetota bacterium]